MLKRIAFGILARDYSATFIYSYPSIRNIISMIQIILLESPPLAIWQPPLLVVPQRVSEFAKLSGPGNIFYPLGVLLNLVCPVGWA